MKSRSNDIENSSLVLSVAIEGIINNVISLASDVDPAFVAQITEAKPAIENLSVGSRALDCLRSSLGNAIKPKPKDTLRRLEKTKVITKNHRDAWSEMRNLNAHGHLIELNNEELQKHLDRFHICLDLFYRLIFLPLEYRGQHRDYSSEKWPSREFIGEQ